MHSAQPLAGDRSFLLTPGDSPLLDLKLLQDPFGLKRGPGYGDVRRVRTDGGQRQCRTRSHQAWPIPHRIDNRRILPPPRGDGPRRAGRSWSTALPPSSHAVESPQPIRRGGLPHLDVLQTTVRAFFLWSIKGDDAGSSRGRRPVRERGRSDRSSALTAWEDGGSAVLQVEAARRVSRACG